MMFFENKEDFEKIVSAFEELYFEKKKLDNISMSEIAEKSEVHLGKTYSIFDSKEAIAIALLEKTVNEVFIVFDEETDPNMPLGDKLKAFLSLQLEFLGSKLSLVNELLFNLANPFSDFSKFVNNLRAKYLNFLTELIKNNHPQKTMILTLGLPLITNSFMVFNIGMLKYWETDKSEGKISTLNFIEKGVKNFMVVSVLM